MPNGTLMGVQAENKNTKKYTGIEALGNKLAAKLSNYVGSPKFAIFEKWYLLLV